MDDATLFDALLRTEDENEANEILERAGYGLANEPVWLPLGGMPNNRSVVTNQQTEATAAFVEKIVNGADALLIGACLERGIDPKGAEAPKSMAEAVATFFGVKDGVLANVPAKEQTELAKRLHVVAVGSKSSPSYLVIDRGEGQTPDDFPSTFLSLIRENKLGIPFVQGKYNCGGTGVLPFCGSQKMQLIVSRRNPKLVRAGDPSGSQWGFTIVRRLRPSATRAQSMYVYLAPGGMVPRFSAATVPVLPDEKSTAAPSPYSVGLPFGTCVKLYNFNWKARSIATTEARYELERFLHSPCLPFRVTETRAYKANYYSTTVAGVWASIGSEDSPEDSKVEEGFPAYGELNPPGVGPLPYRIAVFREEVNPRHAPHGVFLTVNGQVHGDLPSDFVARQLKFDYLKDNLLVSVDCTNMEPSVREDFVMPSRDRVRKNEVYDLVTGLLRSDLRDHAGLRQLNAARRKKEIESTLTDESQTKSLFQEILKSDPSFAVLLGPGQKLITKSGPGLEPPFKGKKFPTYFRLVKNPGGGLTKPCPVNTTCRVEFETDAVNDYFRRPEMPGYITVTPANIIEQSSLWNGHFNARFRVPWDTKPGDRIPVTITVEDVQTIGKSTPFTSTFTMIAEKEAAPSTGGKSGNGGGRGGQGATTTAPTTAIPELQWKSFGTTDGAMELKSDGDGSIDFFANSENAYLTTELVKAKEEDGPLIKFWFGYGLLICALGMLHGERVRKDGKAAPNGKTEKDENIESEGDELKRIGGACTGIAAVIIPMIRTLYRGPQASAAAA